MITLENISDLKCCPFKYWLVLQLSIMSIVSTLAQNPNDKISQTVNYEGFKKLFDELPSELLHEKEIMAGLYLSRSKFEKDTINIGRAYYLHSVLYDQPLIGKNYADSIIDITKSSNDFDFPAIGYFLKGYWCYELSEYQEALQNYLIGDSIAKSKGNVTQYIENRKMIALLKNRAGDHLGALEIYLKEIDSLNGIKNNNPLNYSDYLNRLYNVSLTYMHLKNLYWLLRFDLCQ